MLKFSELPKVNQWLKYIFMKSLLINCYKQFIKNQLIYYFWLTKLSRWEIILTQNLANLKILHF